MAYSCSDFTSDILDQLEHLGLINSNSIDDDGLSAQADAALNAIDKLTNDRAELLQCLESAIPFVEQFCASADHDDPAHALLAAYCSAINTAKGGEQP